MSEYQPVPVSAARTIAREYRKDGVLIVSLDRPFGRTHFTTYGRTPIDKDFFAAAGDAIAAAVADVSREVSFEDFRRVPKAEAAAQIEALKGQRDELLAACASLVEFWDQGLPVHAGAEVVAEVRAAIARATGPEG